MGNDELLDQATCPHVDSGWDALDDDWTCWDCGAYCGHADDGDLDFVCDPAHLAHVSRSATQTPSQIAWARLYALVQVYGNGDDRDAAELIAEHLERAAGLTSPVRGA